MSQKNNRFFSITFTVFEIFFVIFNGDLGFEERIYLVKFSGRISGYPANQISGKRNRISGWIPDIKKARITGRIPDIKKPGYPAGRISGAALLYKHDDVAGPGAPMGGGGERQVPRGQSG